MDECLKILTRLKGILSNLKKAPKRRYRATTVQAKLKEDNDLYNLLLETADDVADLLRDPIIKDARAVVFEIKTFIANTQSYSNPFISFAITARAIGRITCLFQKAKNKRSVKMAKVDVKLGTSLIFPYDGTPTHLDSFINSVEFFVDHVENENAAATVVPLLVRLLRISKF